jgi:hypothetical protein
MRIETLERFWPLIYSAILEIWEISEPQIESAAIKYDVPIELYYYSELGLEYFSLEDFQRRDPFTNPDHFEKMFARFDIKDWIFPLPDERYQVSRKTQDAVRMIVRMGDARLAEIDGMSNVELKKLSGLLKQLVNANLEAPEPPEKWAIVKRFHVADIQSPLIAQVRELLMDLYAYRDDSHLSAARPHFGQAGIVWNVLGLIWDGTAVNSKQLAEVMSFRGYTESDYEVAIQAAVQIGWIEPANMPDVYRLTQVGTEIREQTERLTNEYFYRPWTILTGEEQEELFSLLTKLRDCLVIYKKSQLSDAK